MYPKTAYIPLFVSLLAYLCVGDVAESDYQPCAEFDNVTQW